MAPQLTAPRADHSRRPHLARLRAIVGSRMWKWLFDAHRLLGISVEVLDDQFALLLPSRDGRSLRERFESDRGEALQPLLASSLADDAPLVLSAGPVRLACAPIVGAGVLAGAVLVAADDEARLTESDLARLSALVADTIVDQLSRSAGEHRGNLHQISALYQLLHEAIATGSEHEVVRTFAEALSIWEDLEVLAYRADLTGRYALAMALPGSDPHGVPSTLAADQAPEGPHVMRLSSIDRSNIGFNSPGETVLARLASDGGPWLVAMNAARGGVDVEHAEMYIAALAHALNGCVAVETSRLTWAVMQQFVDRDPSHDAARRAIEELSRALSARVSLTVLNGDGSPLLAVGDRGRGDQGSASAARVLRSPIAVPPPYTTMLEARAVSREPFNPRDVKLFEAVAGSVAAWLPSALRTFGAAERRRVARSFDQIVDRYAREAHASNDAASLILISAGDRALSLDTTHAWIKRLRPQLRPTDLAGRLASGELGILLLQTPHAGAQVVARRLSRVLVAPPADDEPPVRIGVASQFGDLVSAEALIARAREQSFDRPVASS